MITESDFELIGIGNERIDAIIKKQFVDAVNRNPEFQKRIEEARNQAAQEIYEHIIFGKPFPVSGIRNPQC